MTEYGQDSFFQFPAGEWSFKPDEVDVTEGNHYAYVRGTDVNDYVKLAIWSDALFHVGNSNTAAIIPYLPAARADRAEKGMPMGAGVYAELINAAALKQVICFDPHSEVMPDMIVNLKSVSAASFLRHAPIDRSAIDAVLIPDKGAYERSKLVAAVFGVPTVQATKERNPLNGNLTDFECPPLDPNKRYLVADDICDGGGTFKGLATATGLPKDNLALWVSHGVFSGKAYELHDYYGEIITTDSLPTAQDISAVVTTLRPHLESFLDFGDDE